MEKTNSSQVVELVAQIWEEHVDLVGGDVLHDLANGVTEYKNTLGGAKYDSSISYEVVKLAVEFASIALHLSTITLAIQERRAKAAELEYDPQFAKLATHKKREVITTLHLLD